MRRAYLPITTVVPIGQYAGVSTLAEWEADLRKLRSDLGPTEPMQIRWFPRREPALRYPLALYASKRVRDEEQRVQRWEVAIYPVSAVAGTSPTVVVDVPADTPLPLTQPLAVEVAGRLEAGAAIAIRLPRGDVVYGMSPARPAPPVRRRRL